MHLHLPVFLVASFISWSLIFLDKKTFSHHLLILAASFLSHDVHTFSPHDVHTTEEVSENQAFDREELIH